MNMTTTSLQGINGASHSEQINGV